MIHSIKVFFQRSKFIHISFFGLSHIIFLLCGLVFAFMHSISLSAQNKVPRNLKPKETLISEVDKLYKQGLLMIKDARTDSARAKAYHKLGDALFKQNRFVNAIKVLETANSYALKSNYLDESYAINALLCNIYRRTGLMDKSTEKLEVLLNIEKIIKDEHYRYTTVQLTALNLEERRMFKEAIPYRQEMLEYLKKKFSVNPLPLYKGTIISTMIYLNYNEVKSGNYHDAMVTNRSVDSLILLEKKVMLLELHYLNKALLEVVNKNTEEAINWFNLSQELAYKSGITRSIVRTYEERLRCNLDDDFFRKSFFNEYVRLKDSLNFAYSQVATYENSIQKQKIDKKDSEVKTLILFLILGLIITSLIVIFKYRKRKENKKGFDKTVTDPLLEKYEIIEESFNTTELIEKDKSIEIREDRNSRIEEHFTISEEKEREILNRLSEFELSEIYTDNTFSLPRLASVLETNTKYVYYILKKHREGKSFSDYINSLKIKFIVERLINRKEFLKYKINYLSDLSGFSSHSHFTKIFKKETGIHPSDFIAKLRERNENQSKNK